MVEDIRVVNFYKDIDGQRQWRFEIQLKRDGEWIPVSMIEREDIGNLTVLPGELEEGQDGC
jgi:hypothetical protein